MVCVMPLAQQLPPSAFWNRRDARFSALAGEEVPRVVGVVSLVGDQPAHRLHPCQQRPAARDVMELASRGHQDVEAPDAVCERADLAR
jgi:hypothetical protein